MDNIINEFLNNDKSLLIAPAGYGKTYTIVQCIKKSEGKGKSLILTHTHAGVAALKNALKEQQIDKKCYEIETITSYAQKYVKAYCAETLPEITDKNYWIFILEKAEKIFNNTHIKDVIKKTYSQLFVDEYQDCTLSQHKVILAISKSIPTHILGDPLQGIMDFNKKIDPLVSFYNDDLKDFVRTTELSIPHRWQKEGNNPTLGEYLVSIRKKLVDNLENGAKNEIDLADNPNSSFHFIKTSGSAYSYEGINKETNIINKQTKKRYTYKQLIKCLLENRNNSPDFESLLIISKSPYIRNKSQVEIRANLKSMLYYPALYLLEAIDEKSFYELSNIADEIITEGLSVDLKKLYNFLISLFNKTDIDNWINSATYKIKRKIHENDKIISAEIEKLIDEFNNSNQPILLGRIIEYFYFNLKLKCNRTEFIHSIITAIKTTEAGKSIYKTMIEQRNKFRRIGRKIDGKCLGTVALTKGLEFDTVIILDAETFRDPKELYVAMTRACKNLIIFSQNTKLQPF